MRVGGMTKKKSLTYIAFKFLKAHLGMPKFLNFPFNGKLKNFTLKGMLCRYMHINEK